MDISGNFINGRVVPPVGDRWLDNVEPALGRVAGKLPDSDHEDVATAVNAARAAFPGWSATPTEDRARILDKVADILESRIPDFAAAESRDQGKPVSLAARVDIPRAVANFRFFAGAVRHHQNESSDMDGKALNYTHRKPSGVAGLISPWNLPLYLLTWKIAPALATGNTVVCKPSEMTSLTAFMLAEVMTEAGVPDGVCNLVFGTGPRAGAALVQHPDVPLISFTGGTATARKIITDAAPHFKKLSLELGGKNPNIVFADADPLACLDGSVRAAFTNQGEVCLCGSRIFVERSFYETFKSGFIERVAKLVVGDPKDPNTDLGALVSEAHYNKVRSFIDGHEADGAKLLFGGARPELPDSHREGYFLQPTVFETEDPNCRLMQEEIFGPVVTLTPFDTEDQVVAWANGTKYGLAATIWTSNLSRGHRTARAMDAGIVWVNTWMLRDLRTPFGGMKASGIGREGGRHSLEFFTEAQNICIQF